MAGKPKRRLTPEEVREYKRRLYEGWRDCVENPRCKACGKCSKPKKREP